MPKKILIFFLLLFMVSGCADEGFPSPEDTLHEFIELWNAGEYEAMYGLLSEEAQIVNPQDVFTARYENISTGIGLNTVSLQGIVVDEDDENSDLVKADYSLQFDTTTVPYFTQEYEITLQKGEERWLIDWEHSQVFTELTDDSAVKVTRQFPTRGEISDRNNVPLVYPGTVREVGVVPGRIGDEAILLAGLADILQLTEEKIKQAYTQSWVQPDMFVPIQRVTEVFWQENQDQLLSLQGVMVNRAESRLYDFPESSAPAMGYVAEVTAETLVDLKQKGYRAGDYVGATGMEAHFEERLAGDIGFTITINNLDHDILHTVAEHAPEDGENLILTLDKKLMGTVDWALGKHTGSAVLLNAQTGDILAMVSKPGYNSNFFSLGITAQQYNDLQSLDSPFMNRVVRSLMPPGSAFKPITALIALESAAFDPNDAWDTPQLWQKDSSWGSYHIRRVDRPRGSVDLLRGMKWSDNVYFADLSLKVGWEKFEENAKRLGFGQPPPEFLSTRDSQFVTSTKGDILLADSGFGQGEIQVTPLHLGLQFAAIARGDGNLPSPRITVEQEPDIWLETGFSAENIARVDQALKAAVQDVDAVGYMSDSPRLDLRGKTGTAQISAENQIAWFACYFDDYVLVVALEGDSTITSRAAINVAELILEYSF